MQTSLAIFPESTKLINSYIGVFTKDNFVYYLHSGSPIYCHHINAHDSFRYIIGNLVLTGLCEPGEISKALSVHHRNVNRYTKILRDKGIEGFFNKKDDRRGHCHQMTEEKIKQAQELLDEGMSNVKIGKALEISECTIRYHLGKGTLKKK